MDHRDLWNLIKFLWWAALPTFVAFWLSIAWTDYKHDGSLEPLIGGAIGLAPFLALLTVITIREKRR